MTSYDDLLKEVRTRVADIQKLTSREFIPRMYTELCNENSGITPEDARDRIETDCVGVWSKRTILDALPEETKDPKRQKAGRLRQKKSNSAALTAAPESREILIDTQGRGIHNNPSPNSTSVGSIKKQFKNHAIVNTVTGQRSITPPLLECPNCSKSDIKIRELEDALSKATLPTRASDIMGSSSEHEEDLVVHFEFELHLEDVRGHILSTFNLNKSKDILWFNGVLNRLTGRVVATNIGRSNPQTEQETPQGEQE